jgi:hypothetical protein
MIAALEPDGRTRNCAVNSCNGARRNEEEEQKEEDFLEQVARRTQYFYSKAIGMFLI